MRYIAYSDESSSIVLNLIYYSKNYKRQHKLILCVWKILILYRMIIIEEIKNSRYSIKSVRRSSNRLNQFYSIFLHDAVQIALKLKIDRFKFLSFVIFIRPARSENRKLNRIPCFWKKCTTPLYVIFVFRFVLH